MTRREWDGTRFRLFPQYDEGFAPEIVTVSAPAGSLGPGPDDGRMYVANAIDKAREYEPPADAPPYRGALYRPAEPDRRGHFDKISFATPQFRAAHLFGTVRLVLDIWERHGGAPVRWWHPEAPARLELVPLVRWRNAHAGPGFLETGIWPGPDGVGVQPFCLNFDVVAHEVGHAILFGLMGVPPPDRVASQFLAFHECFGDTVAWLGALHFPGVRRRLLDQTAGDLYAPNLVNRLGETAPHQQIRMVSNGVTMADVAGLRVTPAGAWIDPLRLGRNEHHLSQPLTGAIFDLFVELYQHGLAERALIRPVMDARGWSPGAAAVSLNGIHAAHQRAYAAQADAFEAALLAARDTVLGWLLHAVRTLSADQTCFESVAARMLEAAAAGGWSGQLSALLDVFLRRGIDPRPSMTAAPLLLNRNLRASRRGAVIVPGCGPAAPAAHVCTLRHVRRVRGMMPHAHRAA